MLTPDTPGGRDRSAGPARKRLRTQPATGTVANGTAPKHLPFADAIAYMHTLSLRSQKEFREFVKTSACPAKIPRQPQRVYEHDGWLGFPHWLGVDAHKGPVGGRTRESKAMPTSGRKADMRVKAARPVEDGCPHCPHCAAVERGAEDATVRVSLRPNFRADTHAEADKCLENAERGADKVATLLDSAAMYDRYNPPQQHELPVHTKGLRYLATKVGGLVVKKDAQATAQPSKGVSPLRAYAANAARVRHAPIQEGAWMRVWPRSKLNDTACKHLLAVFKEYRESGDHAAYMHRGGQVRVAGCHKCEYGNFAVWCVYPRVATMDLNAYTICGSNTSLA